MKKSIIDDIQLINIPDTVELVLSQIKDLIAERKLLPGDRLPSEQKIADRTRNLFKGILFFINIQKIKMVSSPQVNPVTGLVQIPPPPINPQIIAVFRLSLFFHIPIP